MKRSVVGSPLYMAPQLLSREPYSYKCDIWSVGIIIYQLLYGNAPWLAADMGGLARQVLGKPLQFPKEPAVSPEMIETIRRCLQLDERDRISLEELIKSPVFAPSPKKLFEVPQYTPPQIQMLPVLPADQPPKQAPYPIHRVPSEKSPGFIPGLGGSPAIHGEVTPSNRTPVNYHGKDGRRPSVSPGGHAITPTYGGTGGHPNTYRGRPDLSPNGMGGGHQVPTFGGRPRTPVGHQHSPSPAGGWNGGMPGHPSYQPMKFGH